MEYINIIILDILNSGFDKEEEYENVVLWLKILSSEDEVFEEEILINFSLYVLLRKWRFGVINSIEKFNKIGIIDDDNEKVNVMFLFLLLFDLL